MIRNNITIETNVHTLIHVIEELKNGEIRIPPFQRDFVWTRDAIKDLFDSIKKGYPIGSIIIWQPADKMEWQEENKIGAFKIPLQDSSRKFYVLDGCQRLSTLFSCLVNPTKERLGFDENLYSLLFSLYYNLEEDCFEFVRSRTGAKACQIPVSVLLSTSDFRQYSRKNIEPNIAPDKLDVFLDRADLVSRRLVDYQIAIIEITNANIEEAVDIFSRINSKGTDVSLDWMVNALSYKEKSFHFANIIDSLLEQLSFYNFGEIGRNVLFRCIQSSFGKLYIDQTDIENLAKRDDFAQVTKATIPFIIRAVQFLYSELNVVDYKLLPYNIQLIFIMEFFRKLPNPSKEQLKDLERWFWITSYSNYFTMYSLTNQRKAYNQFLDYLSGAGVDIVYTDNKHIPFSVQAFPETIRLGNVRAKTLLLFCLNHIKKGQTETKRFYQTKLLNNASEYASSAIENILCYSDEALYDSLRKLNDEDIVKTLYSKKLGEEFFIDDEFMRSWRNKDYANALNIRKNKILTAELIFIKEYALENE